MQFLKDNGEFDIGIPRIVNSQKVFDSGVFCRIYRNFTVAVEHGVKEFQTVADIFGNGAAAVEIKLLRQRGTAELAHTGEFGRLRREFLTGDYAQKGGFSASVSADEGDLFPGGNGKFGIIVKYLPADGKREIFSGKQNIGHRDFPVGQNWLFL